MDAKLLKGDLEQIMPSDTLELFCIRVIKKPYKNWERVIPYFRFKCIRKCVFAYMEATPLLACRPELAGTLANSEDTDETPHDWALHQGLNCLLKHIILQRIKFNIIWY